MMVVLIWLSGFFIGWGLIAGEPKAMVILMCIGVACLLWAVARGRQVREYISKEEDDQAKELK